MVVFLFSFAIDSRSPNSRKIDTDRSGLAIPSSDDKPGEFPNLWSHQPPRPVFNGLIHARHLPRLFIEGDSGNKDQGRRANRRFVGEKSKLKILVSW